VTRWGLRSRTRPRMPWRSSRAIPAPVRVASVHDAFGDDVVDIRGEPRLATTPPFEQARLADLVCLACRRRRSRR